jgi:general nucleoside transport system permease protein
VATLTVYSAPGAAVPTTGFWTRARKAGAAFVGLGVVAAVLFGALAKSGAFARFTVTETITGSHVDIPAKAGAIGFGLACAAAGALLLATNRMARLLVLLTGLALAFLVVSFLCWQASVGRNSNALALGQLSHATVKAALPLIFGAIAGVLCERSGVINVAIEGQLLTGAFAGALFGTIFASTWAGLIAAALGGVFIAALLAVLAIRYLVDQVVLGVVLNLFALGLTGFVFTQLMAPHQDQYNFTKVFPDWSVPGLSRIPILGPALFRGSIFLYLAIAVVVVVHVGLFHTRWGLRTRAVGEHPTAADTVGVRVLWTRYRNVLLAGVVAGIGGAFLVLGDVGNFNANQTNGKGFIALAALIFGRWSPIGATLAALLFGFTTALGLGLDSIGSNIPHEFVSMLPYLATIVAVAGLVGRVRAPAADGQPYIKG